MLLSEHFFNAGEAALWTAPLWVSDSVISLGGSSLMTSEPLHYSLEEGKKILNVNLKLLDVK